MTDNYTVLFLRNILLSIFIVTFSDTSSGQCTILNNAVQRISYTYVQGGGTNATGLAYNPAFNIHVKELPNWFVPNVFSPNGDGNNDFFTPIVNGPVEILSFSIFDRIGEKVYEQQGGFGSGWDGKYKGLLVPPGVFVYYVQMKNSFPVNAETVNLKGTVTVIR